jgi:hypothetical protein
MPLLLLSQETYDILWTHLLPEDSLLESAAFLFVEFASTGNQTVILPKDYWLAGPNDFAGQFSDYLELTDEARRSVITRAHQLNTALVEMHSHPGPWPAAFSPADCHGLREMVPHIQWRLKGKPYLAIVVAPRGYDALLWEGHAKTPVALGGIQIEKQVITPTNLTIGVWKND